MRYESFTMREAVGLSPAFPAWLRSALVATIEKMSEAEVCAALARGEHDSGNFDSLLHDRLRDALADGWRARRSERVSGAPRFLNDGTFEGDGVQVSLEIEKGDRGRFDLDLLKMLAFASRRHPSPCFGVLVVPLEGGLPRDVTGTAGQTAFAYLRRTARLLWETPRENLEDLLVIGFSTGAPAEESLLDGGEDSRRVRPAARIRRVEGTQSLDLESIGRLVGGRLGDVVTRSTTLLRLRAGVLRRVPGLQEKLYPDTRHAYLSYAIEGIDRAVLWLQQNGLIIDLDRPRSPAREQALRDSGFEVRYRNNWMGRAGWTTGIRVSHHAEPALTDRLVEEMDAALGADETRRLF